MGDVSRVVEAIMRDSFSSTGLGDGLHSTPVAKSWRERGFIMKNIT
jgi:hypothetical protein